VDNHVACSMHVHETHNFQHAECVSSMNDVIDIREKQEAFDGVITIDVESDEAILDNMHEGDKDSAEEIDASQVMLLVNAKPGVCDLSTFGYTTVCDVGDEMEDIDALSDGSCIASDDESIMCLLDDDMIELDAMLDGADIGHVRHVHGNDGDMSAEGCPFV